MFRSAIVITLLSLAPYVHMVYTWSTGANVSGDFLLWSLLLLFASPLVLGVIVFAFIRSSIKATRDGIAKRQPIKAAGGAVVTSGLAWVMGSAVVATAGVAGIFLTLPEPGRDQLGRICETTGSTTTCRPDPEADQPSELEMINAARKRKQWFEAD